MEKETFEAVMDQLSELQDEAMASREEESDGSARELYFSGKDLGLAEAKRVVREAYSSDNVSDDVQSAFERGSTKDEDY